MSVLDGVSISGIAIAVGVFTREHCSPQATCRDNARNRVARLEFSFLDDVVTLMDILPVHGAPAKRVTDALENLVAGRLAAYREKWGTFSSITR